MGFPGFWNLSVGFNQDKMVSFRHLISESSLEEIVNCLPVLGTGVRIRKRASRISIEMHVVAQGLKVGGQACPSTGPELV